MHIHDVDLVQYIFGEPERILAVSEKNTTYCDSVTTIFKYKSGYVNIIGDWGMPHSTLRTIELIEKIEALAEGSI